LRAKRGEDDTVTDENFNISGLHEEEQMSKKAQRVGSIHEKTKLKCAFVLEVLGA